MTDYESHPDWLALCKAVIAAPTDNLLRLVAADWLDENGQPGRAYLIRSQVAAGPQQWAVQPGTAAEFTLDPRLFGDTSSVSLAPARSGVGYVVERGFLCRVDCPFEVWRDIGPAIARVNPLEKLVVTDKQPEGYSHAWAFLRTQPAFASHQLPGHLFSFFQGGILDPYAQDSFGAIIRYSKRKDAHAALSNALIAWARDFAEDTGRVRLRID